MIVSAKLVPMIRSIETKVSPAASPELETLDARSMVRPVVELE